MSFTTYLKYRCNMWHTSFKVKSYSRCYVIHELGGHSPCIPLVLLAHFRGHRYPPPPIGVGSIYMHIFICNVFLTTQYGSPSPPKGGDGCNLYVYTLK
jgi:hypothetical protein